MKLILISITLAVVLLVLACQKEIAIDLKASHNKKLFIEGMLYVGQIPKIFISTSNAFFSLQVTPQEVFARGVQVTIQSENKVDRLTPDSTFNKFRCRWELFYRGQIAAEYGKTYTMVIRYEGKTYTAHTTINQRKPKIDKVEYTAEFFDVYGGHDGVIIDLTDPAGTQDNYRFQMNRIIDTSVRHAHVLDLFVNTCTKKDEEFPVTDIGRIVFTDENADGSKMKLPIEVTYEYDKDDEGWIFIQSLDKKSAAFYKDLDDQLQAIQNPFVEPVFIHTQIEGAVGVFGSAVLSDSVHFVYPRDNP